MNKLNPSIKYHLGIGAFVSLWIFVFCFFIRPFDDGTVFQWGQISFCFGLIVFLCYAIVAILQKAIYQKKVQWTVGYELLILFLFNLLYSIFSYVFYKGPVLNGTYNFIEFSTKIILKSSLILTPIIILARTFLIKLIPDKEDTIIIKGESKLDTLKIHKSDLICIKSSQNYVEIFFLMDDQLNLKVIRASLKKIQKDFEFLVQVHRSYLINPTHFKFWKNQNTVALTQIEVPVSKSYRNKFFL
ncbi:LytTR family transcriptional regulator DNA-binding domain-containing protein [Flagellimonas sp. S174]|uniref:LytTR family transcriptional regulator DNA-binding domain-containing protein n=1 Tax=Flagellimonas sp. S174 TaxID=3410790 RepID=UPI003BF480B9